MEIGEPECGLGEVFKKFARLKYIQGATGGQ